MYEVGDGINLRHTVLNPDGVATAATVTLLVTKPDGTTDTPAVSTSSTGVYDAATFVADQAGYWVFRWSAAGAVVDVTDGSFTVAALSPGLYSDLPTLRAMVGANAVDVSNDQLLLSAIRAASRSIDRRCGRIFYRTGLTVRQFVSPGRLTWNGTFYSFTVDDIADTTGLLVGGVSWTGVGPLNATVMGSPVTYLISDDYAANPFTGTVSVTARWGWPAVPEEISHAAALLAARLWKRKDSPQGVIGSDQWGVTRVARFDPDVESLIAPYRLPGFA